MYAIVETGGKQIRVEVGSRIFVEKLDAEVGKTVTLDKVLGYKNEGIYHDYLDSYEEEGNKINEAIKSLKIEEAVIEKAEKEHKELVIDTTYLDKYSV